MIKAGQVVYIKPEWQDAGDDKLKWRALEDEDGGRVRIAPALPGFTFRPNTIVTTEMLCAC